jgi:hypothetical protein
MWIWDEERDSVLRNMIEKIDDFLIARTRTVATWALETFGISNYAIARFGIGLCMVNELADVVNRIDQFLPKPTDFVNLLLMPALVFILTVLYMACLRAEKAAYSSSRTMEFWLQWDPYTRLFWTGLLIYGQLEMLYKRDFMHIGLLVSRHFWEVGYWIFLYFVAIGPLPPVTSKVRKLIESWFARPVTAGA